MLVSKSEKVDLRTMEITGLKWDIFIREVIEQEVIAILNMYKPKNKSSKIKGLCMCN